MSIGFKSPAAHPESNKSECPLGSATRSGDTLGCYVCTLFWNFGLDLWSRTIWSRTINNLEEYFKSNMFKDSMLQESIPFQENAANMLLEKCLYQIWSWSIWPEKIFQIINDQGPYMIQDDKSSQKSKKKRKKERESCLYSNILKSCPGWPVCGTSLWLCQSE